jgi:hypothetical protein
MNFQFYIEQQEPQFVPIDTIDGIKVSFIIYKIESMLVLEITPTHYKYTEHLKLFVENEAEFNTAIEEIKYLRFNKFLNVLCDCRVDRPNAQFYKRLDSSNIKMKFDECCVCLEETFGKTLCNHYICGKCENSLSGQICPMCRSEIKN